MADKTTVTVIMVEELFEVPMRRKTVMKPMWRLMPEELVEKVLLFLPATSQARFQGVCKRWKELMRTVDFQRQSASTAFCRGYPMHILKLGRLDKCSNRLREVEFPGLILPRSFRSGAKMFTQTGLPVLGLACLDNDTQICQCFLLNLANKTWQKLPTFKSLARGLRNWRVWLVPTEGTNFHVFISLTMYWTDAESETTVFRSHAGTSTGWRTITVPNDFQPYLTSCNMALMSGGKYVIAAASDQRWTVARLSLRDGSVDPLADLPRQRSRLLSDCSADAVFAYGSDHSTGLFLYKWDESSRQWICLISERLPPGFALKMGDYLVVDRAKRGWESGAHCGLCD